jgi:hypothetical protein
MFYFFGYEHGLYVMKRTTEYLAFVNPNFDAYRTVRRESRCNPEVDIRPQRLKRQ